MMPSNPLAIITDEQITYPEFVRYQDTPMALRSRGGGKYKRDAGGFSFWASWKGGQLVVTGDCPKHLHGQVLVECTLEEYLRSNNLGRLPDAR